MVFNELETINENEEINSENVETGVEVAPVETEERNPADELDAALVEDAQGGDEYAVGEIFGKYKNFVYLKARNYFLMGAEKEDLIQEGMIGLLKAIRGYDKNKLTSFKTFASICIKRQLITAIKTANSQKNLALNSIVDIYEREKDDNRSADDEISFAGKGFSSYVSYDPEEIYMTKEEMRELITYLKDNLSGFEYEVFSKMLEGLNYKDIAEKMVKKIKSIDNAMQRIKRKSEQWIKEYKGL